MARKNSWNAELRGATRVLGNMNALAMKFTTSDVWVVGTNVEYSVYVEFGTSRAAAQPYLRPAVEYAKRNVRSWLKQARDMSDFLRTTAMRIEAEAKRLCPVDTGRLRASLRAEKIR